MRCPSCNQDNPGDAAFCEGCGAKLELICPACKASVSPGARFCRKCGTAIGPTKAAASTTVSSPKSQIIVAADGAASEALEGERKTVTALFADIKGSTEMMRDLDPEEARAIIDPALKLMIDAAHRYDGYVVQSTGDGIFALFGAPVAHEDHPQRALHAAIAMQRELRGYAQKEHRLKADHRLKPVPLADHSQKPSGDHRLKALEEHRLKPVPLEVRIGINTGEVVLRMVHTGGHTEYTPVGHAANLAARMQTVAPAGGIVISEDTRRLVEGYFELRDLGKTEVKGISEPINVYEVIGAGPARGHFELAARRGLTKFVGREREVAEMKRALELARAGHGQIVAAVAEAGTGKSRLVYEFKAMLPGDCKVLEAYSVSYGKASAWLPVLQLLHDYFGIQQLDDPATRREKIRTALATLDAALLDTKSYLFSLLAIPENPDPLAQMDPQVKRKRTMDSLKRTVLRESVRQPIVIIFEDLHWIDGETQALLDLLADGIANSRILLLVNYRPEYRHEWGNKTYYTQLRLDPLGQENATEMLSTLLGDGIEVNPLKHLITERTEGNPFFMEEMVQTLFDEGALVRNGAIKMTRRLSQLRLPPTVQGILAARIDRLGAELKDLLQTLAVMGRESPFALIRRVAAQGDAQLEQMLSDLQASEFIYEQPAAAGVEYTFKHALTQEVAYNSLLIGRRKLFHERAGAAIESLYADRLDDHLSQLAHHYSCSANARKAVHFLGRAGRQAQERSAYPEALVFLTRGLELLAQLPNDTERALQEFDLQMALGWLVYQTKGPAAAEREVPVVRARELAEQLGDETKLTEALIALANLMCNRGAPGTREVAKQALASAERCEDAGLLAGAHYELGHIMYFCGEFAASNEHCERAFELFGAGPYRNFWEAENARASAIVPVWNSILLGYPDTARKRSNDILALARLSPDPTAIALPLLFDAGANWMLGDATKVLERAEEDLAIGAEYGLGMHVVVGTSLRGWALAVQGQVDEGIAEMRRFPLAGLAAAAGSHMSGLAEVYLASERPDEGLEAVSYGLNSAEKTGQRNFDARLHQLQGELLLMQSSSNAEGAESCFRTAVEIARRQDAKLWELKATNSLARLLAKQGKRDEARTMLAQVYDWFTEGFDTADLKDAKALLDELSIV